MYKYSLVAVILGVCLFRNRGNFLRKPVSYIEEVRRQNFSVVASLKKVGKEVAGKLFVVFDIRVLKPEAT